MKEKQALINRERGIREAQNRVKQLKANRDKNVAKLNDLRARLKTAKDKKAFMAMQAEMNTINNIMKTEDAESKSKDAFFKKLDAEKKAYTHKKDLER